MYIFISHKDGIDDVLSWDSSICIKTLEAIIGPPFPYLQNTHSPYKLRGVYKWNNEKKETIFLWFVGNWCFYSL